MMCPWCRRAVSRGGRGCRPFEGRPVFLYLHGLAKRSRIRFDDLHTVRPSWNPKPGRDDWMARSG